MGKDDSYNGGNCHKLSRLSTGSGDCSDAILEGSDSLLKNLLNTVSVQTRTRCIAMITNGRGVSNTRVHIPDGSER